MATAKATTDHNKIRQWVEKRGGFPARREEVCGEEECGQEIGYAT